MISIFVGKKLGEMEELLVTSIFSLFPKSLQGLLKAVCNDTL